MGRDSRYAICTPGVAGYSGPCQRRMPVACAEAILRARLDCDDFVRCVGRLYAYQSSVVVIGGSCIATAISFHGFQTPRWSCCRCRSTSIRWPSAGSLIEWPPLHLLVDTVHLAVEHDGAGLIEHGEITHLVEVTAAVQSCDADLRDVADRKAGMQAWVMSNACSPVLCVTSARSRTSPIVTTILNAKRFVSSSCSCSSIRVSPGSPVRLRRLSTCACARSRGQAGPTLGVGAKPGPADRYATLYRLAIRVIGAFAQEQQLIFAMPVI